MTVASEHRLESKREFSLELCLYLVSLGLALALRLHALGRFPLLDAEADLALSAWRLARGLPTSLRGYSPLLLHLNSLLFFFTNGSDAQARLWGVLFGSALVVLPYGLRQQLGRLGALATSFLLAISPSFTYFSRSVDGSIIIAFCELGLMVAVVSYSKQRKPAYLVAMALLLVLGLLAGALFYTLLTMLLTFVLTLYVWNRLNRGMPVVDELRRAWQDALTDARAKRSAMVAVALLFLALGTAFLANPAGLQMTLDQFGQWATHFAWLGGVPWYRNVQIALLYETLPVLLGLAALLTLLKHHDTFALFLHFAFAFALVFSIVPGYRPANSVLLVLLPLCVAAGKAVDWLGQEMQSSVKQPAFWALVACGLAIFAAAYVQFVTYLMMPVSTYLMRILALLVLLCSAHAMVWSLMGPQVPWKAALSTVFVLLLVVLCRSELRLNYVHARDSLEPIVGATTSSDVLELARLGQKWSHQLNGDPRVMDWQVDQHLEVPLGWYLRSFDKVGYFSTAPATLQATAVVLPMQASAPARYVGMRFRLHSVVPEGKTSKVEWLRWWIGYRSSLAEKAGDEVMLWIKAPQQQ